MPKTFGNFESVVRGRREKKEVARHTLQREELQAVPGSFNDPLRDILNLPGLARIPYAAGGLVVRGAATYDTGSCFDGVQLPCCFISPPARRWSTASLSTASTFTRAASAPAMAAPSAEASTPSRAPVGCMTWPRSVC